MERVEPNQAQVEEISQRDTGYPSRTRATSAATYLVLILFITIPLVGLWIGAGWGSADMPRAAERLDDPVEHVSAQGGVRQVPGTPLPGAAAQSEVRSTSLMAQPASVEEGPADMRSEAVSPSGEGGSNSVPFRVANPSVLEAHTTESLTLTVTEYPLLTRSRCDTSDACAEVIQLFNTGTLVRTVGTSTTVLYVGPSAVEAFDALVYGAGLPEKECAHEGTTDSTTYVIYVREEPLRYPACGDDLIRIDFFLAQLLTESEGGQ